MSDPAPVASPNPWPELLTIADYARACSEVAGKPVSHQAINDRVRRGTLATESVSIGGKVRRYINTVAHPPGQTQQRWPDKPAKAAAPAAKLKPAQPQQAAVSRHRPARRRFRSE